MIQYNDAWVILRNVEVIIFEHGCYFPALEQTRILIFSSYVLLACINNTKYQYGHVWVI